jgi:protein TonB
VQEYLKGFGDGRLVCFKTVFRAVTRSGNSDGIAFLALVLGLVPAIASGEGAHTPPRIDTSGVNMQPGYPQSAVKTGVRGATLLGVLVGENGRVKRIRFLETSGYNDLDSAAVSAVMGWKFVPATANGRMIEGATAVQIGFQPPSDSTIMEVPKPEGAVFSQTVELEAASGQSKETLKAVPCATGEISAIVQTEHSRGAVADWRAGPFASLFARAGEETVWVGVRAHDTWQFAVVAARGGEFVKGSPGDTYIGFSAQPLTVSIAWNRAGTLTVKAGNMETDVVLMQSAPQEVGLSASGGAVKFTDPEISCTPDGG